MKLSLLQADNLTFLEISPEKSPEISCNDKDEISTYRKKWKVVTSLNKIIFTKVFYLIG